MELLRPNPFDHLKEPTLNAALALINSIQPRSEMEALMAVQIVATGLSGIRYLRQSRTIDPARQARRQQASCRGARSDERDHVYFEHGMPVACDPERSA